MRHAAMLIGQTGGGKSVILNMLARAQTRMGRRTTLHVLDPKATHRESCRNAFMAIATISRT